MTERLPLPVKPAPADPPAFPIVGVLAPIAVAALLYAVLRSPGVLLLAVLSPVLAVAAVLDGRLQARRRARQAATRHDDALADLERLVTAHRAAAAAEAHRRAPGPAALAADPASWAGRPPSGELVLGTADLPVAAVVTGAPTSDRERALVAAGRTVPAAPVVIPAEATVAVAGPAPLVGAFARAVAVARLRGAGSADGPTILDSTDRAAADLVVRLTLGAQAVVVHASGPAADLPVRSFAPALLTAAAAATARGTEGALPLAALLADPARGGLAARFAEDADGPADLDLVEDGPHAIVGGTTGSGKSALLTAWVLALAAAHPPERLVLLLVDCKGGATFDPLAALPHVAGVVTDLDPAGAHRAVASLGAELRRREQAARDAGVADAVAAGCPRLVVVVDEYRALVAAAPELAALFTDLASRGRSLGVHLILCTQRPVGSVREEVLANCGIRVCLRVHDAADSRAIVGTDEASRLSRTAVGAAVVQADRRRRVRVAQVTPDGTAAAVAAIAAAHPASLVDPPWLPPLPDRLPLPAAPHPGVLPLGVVDLPETRRQPVLAWDPVRERRLLVVGDPGSGRTTALAAIAAGLRVAPVPADPAELWDALQDDAAAVLVDDLDHLLDRLGPVHAAAAVERLAERLRDPAAAPTVVTARGPAAWSGLPLRSLPGLFDGVLLLRLGLDDHLAAGGERHAWSDRLVPGRGWYAGHAVQIGEGAVAPAAEPRLAPPIPDGPVLVVTARPAELAVRLTAAGRLVLGPGDAEERWAQPGVAVVGAPQSWQHRWQALGRARTVLPVVADRVGTADLRTLLGVTEVLMPVGGPDRAVLLPPEGAPCRVRLP